MSSLRKTLVLTPKDITVNRQTSQSTIPTNLARETFPRPCFPQSGRNHDHNTIQKILSRKSQQDLESTERALEALMRPSIRQSCPEPQIRRFDVRQHESQTCHRAMPIKRESLDLLVSTGHAARDRRARGRNIKARLIDIV